MKLSTVPMEDTFKCNLTFPIRLALVLGDIVFEDERITSAQLSELKSTLPYRQLPVLTINGTAAYSQSHAIARFVALSGLYPTDDLQLALAVDEIDDFASEILELMLSTHSEANKDKKKAVCEALVNSKLADMLDLLEARLVQLKQSNAEGGKGEVWVLNGRLSTADVAVHGLVSMAKLGWLEFVPTTLCEGFPTLVSIHHAVDTNPKVVAWKQSRA
ncbi:hypothetical protein DYB26_013113 [Aphanomyces astaci]|uniref:GST N-terminal domain-containing protein n=2 Tax=Aphanomyces astaci TaxID=112090 RepID=A0A3R6XG66_APHAT|nr:hypothetical protein DYB26_013113 [Aphanomyces astaci]